MSKPHPPIFRTIAQPLDVPDADLDRLNSALGVPELVKPAKAASSAPAVEATSPRPKRIRRLSLDLPDDLHHAILEAALRTKTNARTVVLTALKRDGFQIADDELVDRRRNPARI